MAPISNAVVARNNDLVKLLAAKLGIPPTEDPIPILLSISSTPEYVIPPGADRTMTVDSPAQDWFLIVAILCIAFAGIFLIVRVYTKLAIVRSFELADYFLFMTFVR